MKTVSAKLNMLRQSPRKVRLAADAIRGKAVSDALVALSFLNKSAASPIKKLVQSAAANAKGLGLDPDQLKVKKISVDTGTILYRRRFRARGRVMPVRKRTSHISLVLEEKPMKKDGAEIISSKKSKPNKK